MYNPNPFCVESREAMHALIRERPLATLLGPDMQATHLPMHLDAEHGVLRAHMARANPHWRALDGVGVLAVFHGPEHYVSPSWYPSKAAHGKVVPTWNYVAVHVRGACRVHQDGEWIARQVDELTRANEAAIGSDWQVADAPADYITALTANIVGIEVAIESIEGKWKLSQNRPDADRLGVIRGLDLLGTSRATAVADVMRTPE